MSPFRVSPRRRTPGRSSHGAADALALQCQMARLPIPEREYRFDPARRWRFDLAWPAEKFAIEIDGGVFLRHADGRVGGRHNFGAGYRNDIEKFATATAMLGWRVMRCLPEQVTSGQALVWCESALAYKP